MKILFTLFFGASSAFAMPGGTDRDKVEYHMVNSACKTLSAPNAAEIKTYQQRTGPFKVEGDMYTDPSFSSVRSLAERKELQILLNHAPKSELEALVLRAPKTSSEALQYFYGDSSDLILYILRRYHVNTSAYASLNGHHFSKEQLEDILETFEDYPYAFFKDIDYARITVRTDGKKEDANHGEMKLRAEWPQMSSLERQREVAHTLGHIHYLASGHKLVESQAWLDVIQVKDGRPTNINFAPTSLALSNPIEHYAEVFVYYRYLPYRLHDEAGVELLRGLFNTTFDGNCEYVSPAVLRTTLQNNPPKIDLPLDSQNLDACLQNSERALTDSTQTRQCVERHLFLNLLYHPKTIESVRKQYSKDFWGMTGPKREALINTIHLTSIRELKHSKEYKEWQKHHYDTFVKVQQEGVGETLTRVSSKIKEHLKNLSTKAHYSEGYEVEILVSCADSIVSAVRAGSAETLHECAVSELQVMLSDDIALTREIAHLKYALSSDAFNSLKNDVGEQLRSESKIQLRDHSKRLFQKILEELQLVGNLAIEAFKESKKRVVHSRDYCNFYNQSYQSGPWLRREVREKFQTWMTSSCNARQGRSRRAKELEVLFPEIFGKAYVEINETRIRFDESDKISVTELPTEEDGTTPSSDDAGES